MSSFELDVLQGLKATPKYLPSKYFYDHKGDELFIKIMNSPEYYLTDCEFEILSEQAKDILSPFEGLEYFEIIELGAGNGKKTVELLRGLNTKKFTYKPVDISSNALELLSKRLKRELPQVRCEPEQGEYFKVLESLRGKHPKLVLFLGSNLGNMVDERAASFLGALSQVLNSGDRVLLGLDLIKSREIVLPAYNDKNGYTAAFNLNLLKRINKELLGDFQLDKFVHSPEYDEVSGLAKSYLTSTENQVVSLNKPGVQISFQKGERVFMEVSRKYNDQILKTLLTRTQLLIEERFLDSRKYFCDYLLARI
ncbi:L-histidine N(alpha)-methyltransferase [Luteibaculum oceani]|uniref:L-histidine N(Alpha)-methyltransferase n=1 Tax=Luteibaculum oceani TaxID=1294296 RepID=A0A5C6VEA7_9FLAO|nr:L-histidine N(alpha)-methyltransferase [Luteibaculum oceani]TXC82135.1 L-histidine N(alpha)-methyltransferase [Luteibaculum oceani]